MKKLKAGDNLLIHCYKHDGVIHRVWDQAVVLEMGKDYLICGNNKTKVTERSGSIWQTREPAVIYFFKNRWFNIIAQMKKDGIYFYCNIATPYIVEEGALKYIDYDLDLRVYPNGHKKVLDEMEYAYHRNKMKYGDQLDRSIKKGLEDLIYFLNKKPDIMKDETIKNFYQIYQSYTESK